MAIKVGLVGLSVSEQEESNACIKELEEQIKIAVISVPIIGCSWGVETDDCHFYIFGSECYDSIPHKTGDYYLLAIFSGVSMQNALLPAPYVNHAPRSRYAFFMIGQHVEGMRHWEFSLVMHAAEDNPLGDRGSTATFICHNRTSVIAAPQRVLPARKIDAFLRKMRKREGSLIRRGVFNGNWKEFVANHGIELKALLFGDESIPIPEKHVWDGAPEKLTYCFMVEYQHGEHATSRAAYPKWFELPFEWMPSVSLSSQELQDNHEKMLGMSFPVIRHTRQGLPGFGTKHIRRVACLSHGEEVLFSCSHRGPDCDTECHVNHDMVLFPELVHAPRDCASLRDFQVEQNLDTIRETENRFDMIVLSGHGIHCPEDSARSGLFLGAGGVFPMARVKDLLPTLTRDAILIMNTCHSATQSPRSLAPINLLALRANKSILIVGHRWSVEDGWAHQFLKTLVPELRQHPLPQALLKTKKSLLGLDSTVPYTFGVFANYGGW